MIKLVNKDLEDASDIMESLKASMAKMTMEEKVDLAARCCAIRKSAEVIEDNVKDEIKKRRKGRMGYVFGEIFKGFLNVFPVAQVDQQKLKVDYPKIYQSCLKQVQQQRITFEAR